MEYLIRFAQVHESFRQPEIQALADLAGIDLEFVYYDKYVCFILMNLSYTPLPYHLQITTNIIFSIFPPPHQQKKA